MLADTRTGVLGLAFLWLEVPIPVVFGEAVPPPRAHLRRHPGVAPGLHKAISLSFSHLGEQPFCAVLCHTGWKRRCLTSSLTLPDW